LDAPQLAYRLGISASDAASIDAKCEQRESAGLVRRDPAESAGWVSEAQRAALPASLPVAFFLNVACRSGHAASWVSSSTSTVWRARMDVAAWLRDLGLGQYERRFRENEIEADVLPDKT
jgi:hypothetical protein